MVIDTILFGGLAPAAISLAIAWLGSRWLAKRAAVPITNEPSSNSVIARYLAAAAFAAAFFVAFELLRRWGELAPAGYWRWLPYLVVLAALVGGLRSAAGLSAIERIVVLVLAAAIVAWLSTPSWGHLALPEPLAPLGEALKRAFQEKSATPAGHQLGYSLILTIAFVIHVSLAERLATRIPAWQFVVALGITSFALAGLLAVPISLKFGAVTIASAASCAGIAAGSFLARRAGDMRSLAFPWSATVLVMALIGYLNSTSRLVGLLLVPLAPLALLVPVGKLSGGKATALRAAILCVALAAATAIVVWQG
jgi:hypothetical protein